jgi:hypothetical protein
MATFGIISRAPSSANLMPLGRAGSRLARFNPGDSQPGRGRSTIDEWLEMAIVGCDGLILGGDITEDEELEPTANVGKESDSLSANLALFRGGGEFVLLLALPSLEYPPRVKGATDEELESSDEYLQSSNAGL